MSVYPSTPSLHAGDNTLVLLKVLVTTRGLNTPTYQIISTTVLPTTPLDPSSIPSVTKMEISGSTAYLYIGTDADIYRISISTEEDKYVMSAQLEIPRAWPATTHGSTVVANENNHLHRIGILCLFLAHVLVLILVISITYYFC